MFEAESLSPLVQQLAHFWTALSQSGPV